MLTSEQITQFAKRGIVVVPSAIDERDVEVMRDRLWSALTEGHGIHRHAPETWCVARPSGFQTLVRSGAFAAMRCAPLCEALDQLFEDGWQRPRFWGQPLVTFPSPKARWDIPTRDWHLDIPAGMSASRCPGVRVFAYLNPVCPQGGGTLAVAGSHRCIESLVAKTGSRLKSSAEIRRALMRTEPWFLALLSTGEQSNRVRSFMKEAASSDGIVLQVVELTGEPGDIVLMDLRVLHTAAPNVRSQPRLMLGQQIFRAA